MSVSKPFIILEPMSPLTCHGLFTSIPLYKHGKQMIGFLYPSLSAGRRQVYHLPLHRDYGDCVWDPHHSTNIVMLDKVQEFTAKVATKCCSAAGSELVTQLGWPTLQKQREYIYETLPLQAYSPRGESLVPSRVSSLIHHLLSTIATQCLYFTLVSGRITVAVSF